VEFEQPIPEMKVATIKATARIGVMALRLSNPDATPRALDGS